MAATPYRPISWTDQNLTKEKLQQMANNDQWLFENSPKMRYNYNGGIVRDNGIKIIAGKSGIPAGDKDWVDLFIYFGNFFAAACRPVVTASVESYGHIGITIFNLGSVADELDYRGFRARVWSIHPTAPVNRGYVHWQAVGL